MVYNNENTSRQSDDSTSTNGLFPAYTGAFPMLEFSNPSMSSLESLRPFGSSASEERFSESSTSYPFLNNTDFQSSELLNDYSSVNYAAPARKRLLDKVQGSLNGAPNDDEVSVNFKIPIAGKKILDNAASGKSKKRGGGHAPCWAITYGYGFRYKDSNQVIWTYCNYNRDICKQANKTAGYQTGALLAHLSKNHGIDVDTGTFF